MYWMPTFTFERRPSSVIVAGRRGDGEEVGRADLHLVAQAVELVRPVAEDLVEASVATGTESGWATQVPSKPSPASRSLSARTRRERPLVGLRRRAATGSPRPSRPSRAPAPVAGVHQQLGVRAHERHGHRHRRAVGQHEVRARRGSA